MEFTGFNRMLYGDYEELKLYLDSDITDKEVTGLKMIIEANLSNLIIMEYELLNMDISECVLKIYKEFKVREICLNHEKYLLIRFVKGHDLVSKLVAILQKIAVANASLINSIMKSGCFVGNPLRQPAFSFEGTDLSILYLKLCEVEGLNKRIIRQLEQEGYIIIADLMFLTKEDVYRIRNFGEQSYKNLKEALDKLYVKMEVYK